MTLSQLPFTTVSNKMLKYYYNFFRTTALLLALYMLSRYSMLFIFINLLSANGKNTETFRLQTCTFPRI